MQWQSVVKLAKQVFWHAISGLLALYRVCTGGIYIVHGDAKHGY